MFRRRPSRDRVPLHLRFARGYQAGLLAGVLIGAGVWYTTQTGLDVVQDGSDDARTAALVVADARTIASTLGRIEDQPTAVILRSDLARELASLETRWAAVLSDPDRPAEVELLLEGTDGLVAEMADFSDAIAVLADAGAAGREALSAVDAAAAGRLEETAGAIAVHLTAVVRSYEARADDSIAGMRAYSHLLFVAAVGFLGLLVALLLRPLKDQLERESLALLEASSAHKAEAERQELASHLSDGLEAAENEDEAHLVVGRAFEHLVPDHRVEMLIGSSEKGTLRAVVTHPRHGGPGCGVESPWACPAVRRGRTMVYDDSRAINACPHLAEREGGACSATCVPISFMGQSMGVLHTTGEVGVTLDRASTDVLNLLASQVSIRLGTLRSFAQVEMQASTDSLTGLPNRRATEDRLRRLVSSGDIGAVAMADLDRFKLLNDRYGHEAGDRALRMFADAVRKALRGDDWIGRWGGEEFLLVLPGLGRTAAKEALDRIREQLAEACVRAEAPAVTVSVGVVDTSAAATGDELVRLADDALLAAKAQGRDRVVAGPVLAPMAEVGAADEDAPAP